jgi:hypothetical protein
MHSLSRFGVYGGSRSLTPRKPIGQNQRALYMRFSWALNKARARLTFTYIRDATKKKD